MTRRLDGSDRGMMITAESLRRIQKTCQRVENGNRAIPAPPLRTMGGDDGSSPLRICRATANWPVGTCQTVEVWENAFAPDAPCFGAHETTGKTLEHVHNFMFDIANDSCVWVVKAANGNHYVVSASVAPMLGSSEIPKVIGGHYLETLPGYAGAQVQILGHDTQTLRWFDVSDCPQEQPCEEGSGSGGPA